MKYEDEKFLIYYDESDKKYILKIIDIVNKKMTKILNFFNLKLKNKIIIKIYNDINKYNENLKKSFIKEAEEESKIQNKKIEPRKIYNWMIANTEDGNINMQSFNLVKKKDDYKDYTEEEYCYNVCHEFVHLCQQRLNSENPGWFWEVLATNLGNPECQHKIKESFTLKDLDNFDEIDGYGAVYLIGQYLFKDYNDAEILEMVNDNDKMLLAVTNIIQEINKNKFKKL